MAFAYLGTLDLIAGSTGQLGSVVYASGTASYTTGVFARHTFPGLVNIEGSATAWIAPESGYAASGVAVASAGEVFALEQSTSDCTLKLYSVNTSTGTKTLTATRTDARPHSTFDPAFPVWNHVTGSVWVAIARAQTFVGETLVPQEAGLYEVNGSFSQVDDFIALGSRPQFGYPSVAPDGAVWVAINPPAVDPDPARWRLRRYTSGGSGSTIVTRDQLNTGIPPGNPGLVIDNDRFIFTDTSVSGTWAEVNQAGTVIPFADKGTLPTTNDYTGSNRGSDLLVVFQNYTGSFSSPVYTMEHPNPITEPSGAWFVGHHGWMG